MKNVNLLHDLLKHKDFAQSIRIYFAPQEVDEDYDEYENNIKYSNLNPITIKGIVNYIAPDKAVYKLYGKADQSFVEVVTDGKYKTYFEQANKVTINGNSYVVLRDKIGSRFGIQQRANNIIRVILERK